MSVTKEKYNEIIPKLKNWIGGSQQCSYCTKKFGRSIWKEFAPYNQADTMLRLRCPKCGHTILFDLAIVSKFDFITTKPTIDKMYSDVSEP